MAEDVSDLVVRMRPEGVPETVQGLNTAEEATQETTEAMDSQADAADGFLQKFQGAMGAAVAGLAVASAGLLSKVPVIGQAMEGLFSLVEGIAFQMDQVLRPVLAPLADGLFNLSQAVFEMNGPLGKTVGILATMGTIFAGALLAPIAGTTAAIIALAGGFTLLLSELGLLEPIISGMVDLFKAIGGVVIGATEGTDEFVQALGELGMVFRDIAAGAAKLFVDAITGLGSTILSILKNTDWIQVGKDILGLIIEGLGKLGEVTIDIGSAIATKIKETDWIQVGKDILGAIVTGLGKLGEFTINLGSKIKDKITSIDWVQAGKNIIKALIEGIKSLAGNLKDAAGDLAKGIKDRLKGDSPPPKGPLSDIDKAGPVLVDTVASGLEANASRLRGASNRVAEAARGGLGEGQTANITNGNSQQVIEVDGRTLGKTTSRKQRSITASRNIDG